ncbi:beta-phosphoglucomutase [Deinobacterium chartae]|uniref:Beta-phosphoglucomutase n=1 Tax=Deinobacterium chartae TaxID=521158 RepID=A0A841HZU6_9DEIO|nr:HAD-IA family hydrolase [Deinobacterium chartae]MBB6097402.1 beta-phosphoglucomutase [Deinobacterium chartae]
MDAALIFDMDGVLADTVGPHYRSWRRLAEEQGFDPFLPEHNVALLGRTREDALTLFLRGATVPEARRAELLARKQALFLEEIAGLGPEALLPGAAELLREARARGVALGLASSSRNAREICRRLGILDFFTAFADGSVVARPKPAPDVFVWVAGRLNLPPARCVVLEDAQAGVRAALEGGFRVVGLGDSDLLQQAHRVFPSLEGVELGELLALLP